VAKAILAFSARRVVNTFMKRTLLTPSQQNIILDYYHKKTPIQTIEEKTGIRRARIRKFLYDILGLPNIAERRICIRNMPDAEGIKKLVNDYRDGYTLTGIMQKHKLSINSVKSILKDNGINYRNLSSSKKKNWKRKNKDWIKIVWKDYNKGLSVSSIANKHSRSYNAVNGVLKEYYGVVHPIQSTEEIREQWPTDDIIKRYTKDYYSVMDLVEYIKSLGFSASRESVIKFLKDQRVFMDDRRYNKLINTLQDKYTDWKEYCLKYRSITESNYRRYKKMINPQDLPRSSNDYQVDHLFSVHEGFMNQISPRIISSPVNLAMTSSELNKKKWIRCSINKEELLDRYHNFLSTPPK